MGCSPFCSLASSSCGHQDFSKECQALDILLAGYLKNRNGFSLQDQAFSMSPLVSIISVCSLVTHSRIYAEQFRSIVPLCSL
jgi:hypothetical protein